MAQTVAKKSSRVIHPATPQAPADASVYCRDLDHGPRSWMGVEEDLLIGEELVAGFRPFIEHRAHASLTPQTMGRHVNNLWLWGGEVIRELNDDASLRKVAADRLLSKAIYEEGGPLRYSGSEEQQRSFDSTCRKLHRFRTQHQR